MGCSSPTPGHATSLPPKPGWVSGPKENAGKPPPGTQQSGTTFQVMHCRSGIDVSTMWKGECFPGLTPHSSWPLCPRSQGRSVFRAAPEPLLLVPRLWPGVFAVATPGLSSRCCAADLDKVHREAVRGRGGSPNQEDDVSHLGHEMGFPGDLAPSRHAPLTPSHHHPFLRHFLPPPSMN